MLYILIAMIVGAALRRLLRETHFSYTVALLLVGLLVGGLDRTGLVQQHMPLAHDMLHLVAEIDPHLLLFIFLPILIFESAYALEVHLFQRLFPQIAILAIPGLVLSALLTAVLVKLVLPLQWPWALALLFGALISATDPVSVTALLREVGSRKRLETLLEGESMLNDGSAIVLFSLFLGLLVSNDPSGISVLDIGGQFLWVVTMGLFCGVGIGWLLLLWIDRIVNDPIIEICLSLIAAYLAFFVAEQLLHVSGVVAVVALALMFARFGPTRSEPEVTLFLHKFWATMAYIANTMIFLLVGILVASRVTIDSSILWLMLIPLYLGLQLIRGTVIFSLLPLLGRIGAGLDQKKAIVLSWGSLRGAVALALAMIVSQHPAIAKPLGDQILFFTAGIVVLSILINGSTIRTLFRYLGLDKLPPGKQATVNRAQQSFHDQVKALIPSLESNEFLHGADWQTVRDHTLNVNVASQEQTARQAEASPEELDIALRRRLLEMERQYYWTEFNQGSIGRSATSHLVSAVERALDGQPTLSPRAELYDLWRVPLLIRVARNIPFLHRLAVNLSFDRLALFYDIARGFIQAQQEISRHINQLAPSEDEAQRVLNEVLDNMRSPYQRIEQLRKSFPEIINTLQTNAAIRVLLIQERRMIENMVDNAILGASEAKHLLDSVDRRMAQQKHHFTRTRPPEPVQIIRRAKWAQGLTPQCLQALGDNAEHRIYAMDEIICHQGQGGDSLIFVFRGTVEVLDDSGTERKIRALQGPGSVVGISVLLNGQHSHTVRACVPVDTIAIKVGELKSLIRSEPLLLRNLEKHLAQVQQANV